MVGEHGRVQAAGELAQVGDRGTQLGLGRVQPGHGLGIAVRLQPRPVQPDPQGQADEALLRTIVQVALQPAPLCVPGLDDPGA